MAQFIAKEIRTTGYQMNQHNCTVKSGFLLSVKILLILVFTGISVMLYPQTKSHTISPPLKESAPETAGMSAERLDIIGKMISNSIEKGEIPGAVVLVARNGKIVYHQAFGVSDPASGREMKTDDIFRIASQTKAITATAVMMLWEEGKFRLDDPISKFIPEFKNAGILDSFNEKDSSFTTRPVINEITIRHLLTHTSGIGYGFIDGDERIRKIYAKAGIVDAFTTGKVLLKDNVRKLAVMPLHHEPGEKYTYSEGLDVLGYLIEVLSGKPLDVFFRERIFIPLNMTDTWFYLPESKSGRLVSVQTLKSGEWASVTKSDIFDPGYPVKGAKTFFAGGAGLSSTAKDYASFLQMYLNMGELNGFRLLSRTTVQFMMKNQIGSLWGNSGEYYGLAFGVLDENGAAMGGRGSVGTFQWGGYFNTMYFADPEENIIGILFKQTLDIPEDNTSWKFRQLVFQAVDN